MASRVTVTPDPFTLIEYDAAEIAGIVEDAAALVGFPPDVEIELEVDEVLFAPLSGCMADVVDGRAADRHAEIPVRASFPMRSSVDRGRMGRRGGVGIVRDVPRIGSSDPIG